LTIHLPKDKALWSFQDCDAWINIWEGAVSSGKSITANFAWVDFVSRKKPDGSWMYPGNLLMCGKTERTLQRNVIEPLVEAFGGKVIDTKGMGRGDFKICGRKVWLVGANDERSEQRIRGMSLVGAYCDEVTLYPESFFAMLMTRLRQGDVTRVFVTTNPDSPYHWLKVNYLDKSYKHLEPDNPEALDLKRYHFTLDDNPYLTGNYVDNLKRTYTGLWRNRYVLGEWCMAEGAVYDMFDEKVHVVKSFDPIDKDGKNVRWYVGVDYGTINPTVFLMIGVITVDNTTFAYCSEEYYYDASKKGKQKTDSEYVDDMKKFIGDKRIDGIIIDPSAASFKLALKRQGYYCKDGDNTVIDGIRTVGNMLQNRHYFINERCKEHIKEFTAYVWDAGAQERGDDKPMKISDHTMDACRYALHTMLGKRGGMKAIKGIY
jgi:PBSX family phage terminase large subunit